MFPVFFRPKIRSLLDLFRPKKHTAFTLPSPSRMEAAALEKAYARLFGTDDGKKVLAHLNALTFTRAAAPDAPDETLRYMEGQRSLLATMMRMIERGRSR